MASRVSLIVGKLKKFYGALPAPPSDAFTLFVTEILSGHATPRKRDAAVAALKRHRALTPEGMWSASRIALEESVALAGPYRDQRLLALKKGSEVFRRNPALAVAIKGPVKIALRLLKQLPRMTGESGAYRMLLFAGGHAVLPVDARVSRVATRLGYGETSANFSKIARSIREAVAKDLPDSGAAYCQAYVYLEHHGSATCTETNPRCDVCPLLKDCRYGQSR
jgi:endonuclease-3